MMKSFWKDYSYPDSRHFLKYCSMNFLNLNASKTVALRFGNQKTNIDKLTLNKQIIPLTSHKHLGLIIDNKLSFNPHIDYICKKVRQKWYLLNRLTKKLQH